MSSEVPDILARIIKRKGEEVAAGRTLRSSETLQNTLAEQVDRPRGFARALRDTVNAGHCAVIAEIKKASPSKGVIRDPFDPPAIARSYQNGGAAALSVLTDQDFFMGSEQALRDARAAVSLPVLRKDFIVDPWQLLESRVMGADCILLIVAALDEASLHRLYGDALALDMDVLVEVHDKEELTRALSLDPVPELIGINNRDLRSFKVSLDVTLGLLDRVPADSLLITESGILQRADVQHMREAGVHAFLVGEALMLADDPGQALAHLAF